ncbi:hypothetical protein X801_06898, partial [Opisthorchis viverrini]
GGIRAVVWTDVLQLLVLTFGLLLIVIMGIVKVGGPQVVWNIALEGKRLQSFSFSPDPLRRHSVWILAFGGAGMVLSIYGAALVGLSTVGLAFLFEVMSSHVLPFAFSLFGAIGGPILSIFTLGILVPCINKY